MDSADPIAQWQSRISELDQRLLPIAKRPVDIMEPGWVEGLRQRPAPLDEAGIRREVETLLLAMVERSSALREPERQRLRELFHTYRSFAWAAGFSFNFKVTDEESLRKHLVLLSIRDQHTDARDEILWLDELCRQASEACIDPRPLLREVAEMSSRVNRYGSGSARDIILQCVRS